MEADVLQRLQHHLEDAIDRPENVSPEVEQVLAKSLHAVKQRMHVGATGGMVVGVRRLTRRRTLAIAVCVLLMLTAGVSWYYHQAQYNQGHAELANNYGNDVPAGSDKATLTLSDGRVVALNSDKKGVVIGNGLTYNDGTSLVDIGQDGEMAAATELTMTTPRGGQYQTTLSDGTKVWLNSGSSLRYPLQFGADKRVVVLEGEAFFDVSHDADRPFMVQVNDTEIEVLGTQFNVNSYHQVTATLVKGSVKIAHAADEQLLEPGQEAAVGDHIAVYAANLEKATAWKDGYFHFKDDPMEVIMEQLARWYDVDVVYEGKKPDGKGYNGRIHRQVNLSSVLEMLTYVSGAKFTVNGKQLIVTIE